MNHFNEVLKKERKCVNRHNHVAKDVLTVSRCFPISVHNARKTDNYIKFTTTTSHEASTIKRHASYSGGFMRAE